MIDLIQFQIYQALTMKSIIQIMSEIIRIQNHVQVSKLVKYKASSTEVKVHDSICFENI